MTNVKKLTATLLKSRGFTLVEMLIAMAVTLLLMAALSKAFGLIGENVRESRVAIDLTNQTRSVTSRLRDELSRATTVANPPVTADSGEGYLVYYEGPLTDATTTILGASPNAANENTYQDAKYGDCDDYLAFTAAAKGDNWFRGTVPRFVLDAKTAELNSTGYSSGDFPGNPLDPIVITSKYAEIVYFVAPEYQTAVDDDDATKRIFVYGTDGSPQFVDEDGNLIPDRMNLHRRVLLIRPDLNLSSGQLAIYRFSNGTQSVEYMIPDRWPTDTASQATEFPVIKTQVTNGLSQPQTAQAWRFGLSAIHQQCDLSVARVNNAGGRPVAGLGVAGVSANSLADLSSPENRFAHIRVPSTQIGITVPTGLVGYTSMPLISLGGIHPLLNRAASNAYTGFSHAPPNNIVPALEGSGATVITPLSLNGFLRPEFILGMDLTHTDRVDGWGDERRGEDVIASNILAFDLKGFDPLVQNFLVTGANGQPGLEGVDDDSDGTTDEIDERGFSGSDDRLVTPNDAAYFEALQNAGIGATANAVLASTGEFVDLMFPMQAGGTLRGGGVLRRDIHSTASRSALTTAQLNAYLQTNLSGYSPNATSSFSPSIYQDSLFYAGKIVSNNAGRILIFQPCYDTYTDKYESDGFLQRFGSNVNGAGFGTLWWFNNNDGSAPVVTISPTGIDYEDYIDVGSNSIDDILASNGRDATGVDDKSEQETRPPLEAKLGAIRVSIRIEHPKSRQIEQTAITQSLN